ncbi:fumarylacetoacetate hydrolase family protein [Camelliibacillus cellulosilyticus]|uniref:Fumarylacetoacetate hydrolase family protein n=1 Tax=Camelliibacillus cellulosilyticus TaxID=2174486 RepID=A0ABV9GLA4_9BACL
MKHARFIADGRSQRGVLVGERTLKSLSGTLYDFEKIDVWLPPIEPRTVYGLALNYGDHADELGLDRPKEPVLFIKPNTSLIGHGAPILYPDGATHMHYENELAVVIGREGRHIDEKDAMKFVSGYTIANDVTVRDFVNNFFRPPIRAKGHDSFGPMGPFFVDAADISDPGDLELRAFVNGELKQRGNTKDLINDIPSLIAFISSFATLMPNDVILTGTPKGISPIQPGDVVRLEIDGLGYLENPVIDGRRETRRDDA